MKSGFVGNVHLVAGNAETIPRVLAFLEKEGMHIQGNPDVYVRTYENFGVDEARELRERASLGAFGKNARVFVVSATRMTSEAQNAFLKTLEEPPANAIFFIILPAPEMLLPTLRSRAQHFVLPGKTAEDDPKSQVDAHAFLKALPQNRLDMLKPLLEKDADDRRDMGAILNFLFSVERHISKGKFREGLESVYRARKYLSDKGALIKPLLEQVALLTPRI